MISKAMICLLAVFVASTTVANAQSFFTNLGTDPATGVDRGSASVVQKVEERTGFLTFSSYGADEIGPYIGSATLAWPDMLRNDDQFDLVVVLGGLSDQDDPELAAVGLGYRLDLPETGLTIYTNADHSGYALGSLSSLALDIKGSQTNAAIGARRVWTMADYARMTASVELSMRDSRSEVLGSELSDERLRMLRAAVKYERGLPFSFQQRYGLSVTKGIEGFGASADANSAGTASGVATDFLRLAFSAEASVPLSARLLVNAGMVGQWTQDSLPVSQRCGYGTNTYARGFDQSYVNGDQCIGGRIELAYNFKQPDPRAEMLDLLQGFVGIDGGVVKDMANALTTGSSDRWSSLSAGFRVAKGDFIGEVSVTHILDKPVGAFPQEGTRIWFQAAIRF